jgi:hypothetical protein
LICSRSKAKESLTFITSSFRICGTAFLLSIG